MPVRTIKSISELTLNKFRYFRSAPSSLKSLHHWKVVAALICLHCKYFFFHTRQLENLKQRGLTKSRITLPQLDPLEFAFANRWNLKISNLFQTMKTPYARCMKRCFVIAHLMPQTGNLDLVIGVLTDNIHQGHAWLELNNEVVADKFNSAEEPFKEVLRISIHHDSSK